MDLFEQALTENSAELLGVLTDQAGFTVTEAEAFLREAAPVLLESYAWQSARPDTVQVGPWGTVQALLSGISGRALAPRVGLSSARTWDGLRALVPAVLRSTGEETAGPEASAAGALPRECHAKAGSSQSRDDDAVRFDIGFGLTLDRCISSTMHGEATSGSAIGDTHPIFGHLQSLRGSPPPT